MSDRHATVLVWVTHLLGTGHLFRTAAIVRALRKRGAGVIVASGGMPIGGIDFADAEIVQLPGVRSPDATFRRLVDSEGREATAELLQERSDRLIELLLRSRPRAIVTELFPFGRRKFSGEVDRMLEAATAIAPKPRVVASIRDILEPPSADRQVAHAVVRLRKHYHAVLVHGDPNFAGIEASFPLPADLVPLVHYTGYIGGVDDPASGGGIEAAGEIVVSAGGGAVGLALYEAALLAAAQDGGISQRWRILIGRNVAEQDFRRLSDRAAGNVTVEWARRDFPRLLRDVAVSVSQAGYNTVADVLAAGASAVLVPFSEGGEEEQTIRSRLLAQAGRAVVVAPAELSPQRLVQAIGEARRLPRNGMSPVAMSGAERSAEIILGMIDMTGQE